MIESEILRIVIIILFFLLFPAVFAFLACFVGIAIGFLVIKLEEWLYGK